jgi:hypothetical protein
VGIAVASVQNLTSQHTEPPEPAFMLLSLFGLAANLTSAFLFADPRDGYNSHPRVGQWVRAARAQYAARR